MRSYALFPGCFISARFPHFESSTLKVLKELGFELKRLKGVTCCPEPVSMHMLNLKAWYTVAARNICLAEEAGLDILTFCNGCNATLFRVNQDLKAAEGLRREVNENLKRVGKKFEGKIAVKSILRVLFEEAGQSVIKVHVKNPLHNIKVAVHYGCHIFDEIKDFDDPKNPKSLKELVRVLGADVVSYPSEMLCCAAFARTIDKELALVVAEEKLNDLVDASADCLVVICPYCFLQYDLSQIILTGQSKKTFEIPILYYPQLLGLAMGFNARDMRLDFHKVKTTKLIQLIERARDR